MVILFSCGLDWTNVWGPNKWKKKKNFIINKQTKGGKGGRIIRKVRGQEVSCDREG